MRTKTFNSIVELLRDGQWHPATEVAERTPYPDEWIDELQRESVVETDDRDGELVVRLRADVAPLEPLVV